jgi:hypothetical protein
VGYGLEGSGPKTSFGGDSRRRAELRLVNLNGVLGAGRGAAAKFSSNANTGGTCFGDSGGPIFVSGTTTVVAVVSFGTSSTCSGTSGGYRLDQPDDLAFLATFGLTPCPHLPGDRGRHPGHADRGWPGWRRFFGLAEPLLLRALARAAWER